MNPLIHAGFILLSGFALAVITRSIREQRHTLGRADEVDYVVAGVCVTLVAVFTMTLIIELTLR